MSRAEFFRVTSFTLGLVLWLFLVMLLAEDIGVALPTRCAKLVMLTHSLRRASLASLFRSKVTIMFFNHAQTFSITTKGAVRCCTPVVAKVVTQVTFWEATISSHHTMCADGKNTNLAAMTVDEMVTPVLVVCRVATFQLADFAFAFQCLMSRLRAVFEI